MRCVIICEGEGECTDYRIQGDLFLCETFSFSCSVDELVIEQIVLFY